ncbi:MAG TPA: bacteriohemerythrin [Bryobacteraceae bacterium]|nr:bacteriohemerythrin [Bryobacteraceae bacterium]
MFEWKPEYSVDLPVIDAQHQRLFALAGELHAALINGKGYSVLEQCLASLVDYTKVHFASEERLMARYSYPQTREHIHEHEQLAAQVISWQVKFRTGETTLGLDMLMFLKSWLEHHIAGSDQRYSAHIRSQTAA